MPTPPSINYNLQLVCVNTSYFKISRLDIDLSHGCEESLSVEESGHPECDGSSIEAPGVELAVSVNQLGEPEPKGTGIPGYLNKRKSDGNLIMTLTFRTSKQRNV